jgi:hypothetical protein
VRVPIEIRGLEALNNRFAALGAMDGIAPALRAEAESVAADARENLKGGGRTGDLAASVEVTGVRGGADSAFAVGTGEPAGFCLEFGTARMRAMPWLVPVLHPRLPGINHAVRKVIAAALKARAKA